MKDASKTLDPATLKIKLLPLEHYTNSMIAGLNSLMEGSSADILRNEAVTFSGESAWRVDHIFNYQGSQLLYGSTILVIKDGKLYEIGFDTKPLKVEEMRPIGEKIIQTFQFTNTNNTGTFQFTNNTDNDSVNDSKFVESKDNGGAKDCSDFDETNFKVQPGDPYGLDPDGDGIACEG